MWYIVVFIYMYIYVFLIVYIIKVMSKSCICLQWYLKYITKFVQWQSRFRYRDEECAKVQGRAHSVNAFYSTVSVSMLVYFLFDYNKIWIICYNLFFASTNTIYIELVKVPSYILAIMFVCCCTNVYITRQLIT